MIRILKRYLPRPLMIYPLVCYNYMKYLLFPPKYPSVEIYGSAFSHKKDNPVILPINVNKPTRLCFVMKLLGSDKGLRGHNFTTFYSSLFNKKKNQPDFRLFELGLGTNNPELPSTMGESGAPGASLRGWRYFFQSAQIFGADIDKDILFNEERIRTFYCDQTDKRSIDELWDSNPLLRKNFDVIIEDGLHTFDANICMLRNSIHKLKDDGVYVVEDVFNDTLDRWRNIVQNEFLGEYPDHIFKIVIMPTLYPGQFDNNLVICEKHKVKKG